MNRIMITMLIGIMLVGCSMPAAHPIESTVVADEPAVNPTIEEVWVCKVSGDMNNSVSTFYYEIMPMIDSNGDPLSCMFYNASSGPPMSIVATGEPIVPYGLRVHAANGEVAVRELPGSLSEFKDGYYLMVDDQGVLVATVFKSKRWLPQQPKPIPKVDNKETLLARLENLELLLPQLRSDLQIVQTDLIAQDKFIEAADKQLKQLRLAEKSASEQLKSLNERMEKLTTMLRDAPPLIEKIDGLIPRLLENMLKASDEIEDLKEKLNNPELSDFDREAYTGTVKLNEVIFTDSLETYDKSTKQKKESQELIEIAHTELPKITEQLPSLEERAADLRSKVATAENLMVAVRQNRKELAEKCNMLTQDYREARQIHNELTEKYNRQRQAERSSADNHVVSSQMTGTDRKDRGSTSDPHGPRFTASLSPGVRVGWEGVVNLYQGVTQIGYFTCRIEGSIPTSTGSQDPLMDGKKRIVVVDSHGRCFMPKSLMRYLDPTKVKDSLLLRERGGENRWLMEIFWLHE
jgi:peptidoglycan hydrolase CwlO-like protein